MPHIRLPLTCTKKENIRIVVFAPQEKACDVTYDEDRSQVRTGNGPRVMASLRNLAIAILRLTGHASITAALRYHARRPSRPLQTIMKC